jgi:hypothetical protein
MGCSALAWQEDLQVLPRTGASSYALLTVLLQAVA